MPASAESHVLVSLPYGSFSFMGPSRVPAPHPNYQPLASAVLHALLSQPSGSSWYPGPLGDPAPQSIGFQPQHEVRSETAFVLSPPAL